jgi:hypothetical protein
MSCYENMDLNVLCFVLWSEILRRNWIKKTILDNKLDEYRIIQRVTELEETELCKQWKSLVSNTNQAETQ